MANKSNSSMMIVIGVIVLAAVAGGGYMLMGQNKGGAIADDSVEALANVSAAAGPDAQLNPVVGKVNGEDILRTEVFEFIERMPEQARRMPVQQLYPLAFEQLVNAKIVEKRMDQSAVEKDPVFKERMALARDQIMRGVFVENEVGKRIGDSETKAAYEEFKKNFETPEEVRARHILVEEETKSKEILQQLNDGASFEELASAHSIDGTAQNGGDLGYFTQGDVVKAFGDVAFTLAPGSVSESPVKSEFGYHIIKVEDKRTRPVPSLDQVRDGLEQQLRRSEATNMLEEWRSEATVERFDINGNPVPETDG